MHHKAVWTAILLSTLPACSAWAPSSLSSVDGWLSDQSIEFPSHPISRSTQVAHSSRSSFRLGIDFIHVEPTELNDDFWVQVDETIIPTNVRRQWLENGLRIGQWINPGTHPRPSVPTESLDKDPNQLLLQGAGIAGRHRTGHEVITLQPSKRHDLPLGPVVENNQVLLIRDGGKLIGRTLETPQCVFAMRATSTAKAGQAMVSLHPEIQHGVAKPKFVSSETAVRINTGREAWELPSLNIDWNASSGQSLVIAPSVEPEKSPPTFGLGHQLLRDREHVEATKMIVLVLTLEQLPALDTAP